LAKNPRNSNSNSSVKKNLMVKLVKATPFQLFIVVVVVAFSQPLVTECFLDAAGFTSQLAKTPRSSHSNSFRFSAGSVRRSIEKNTVVVCSRFVQGTLNYLRHSGLVAPPLEDAGAERVAGENVYSFPGGGLFFWWQAGWVLGNGQLPANALCVGASAGSLTAVLAKCNVDMHVAYDLALALCNENRIFKEPLGLAGKWGGIVRQWLDELLPENAAEICRGKVFILVTTVPDVGQLTQQSGFSPLALPLLLPLALPLRRLRVSDFRDKDDLIDCCMASVHIPWFMDGKFLNSGFRGLRCVDGSFLALPGELSAASEASVTTTTSAKTVEASSSSSSSSVAQAEASEASAAVSGVDTAEGQANVAEAMPSMEASSAKRAARKDQELGGGAPSLVLLHPNISIDHKLDAALAEDQFFVKLKPGPDLVRELLTRGSHFARANKTPMKADIRKAP
jgi:hypothetical protein